jgi:hypothetical protein
VKILNIVALSVALAIIGLAQRAKNNTDEQLKARNAPDLFVYKVSALGPDEHRDSQFTIEVGNTGSKTITAVEWEYYSPRDSGEVEKRSTTMFRNVDLKLLPDQRTKLTHKVHHYTDKFVTSFNLESVRIVRVQYDDGSFWQRPADLK